MVSRDIRSSTAVISQSCKLRAVSFLIPTLLIAIGCCGCAPKFMDQVDFVEIFHWHYSELVFQIEEEDELQELKAFFDALDCQLDEPIESPDRYAGAGTDRIFFYGDGVLIGQYTIYAELVQFKPYGAWYIMDDETGLAWRAYVDGLKASADQ